MHFSEQPKYMFLFIVISNYIDQRHFCYKSKEDRKGHGKVNPRPSHFDSFL